ncbi:MAG TPA: hypothetical protein VHO47_05360 [Candidatus Babeliales bacterium]|nr:hypothetical protein [Candidatus Babeliales bacterium]
MKRMLNILSFLLGIWVIECYAMDKKDYAKGKINLSKYEEREDDNDWEVGIETEKLAVVAVQRKTVDKKPSLYEKVKQKFKALTEKKDKTRDVVIKLDSNFMSADQDGKATFDDILNFELTCVKTKKIEFSQGLGCYLVTLKKPMSTEELSQRLKKWNEVEGVAPAKDVNWGTIQQEREKVYHANALRLSKE